MIPSLNDIYKLDLCVTNLAPNPIMTRGCTARPAFLHTCRDSLEVSADLRVAQYIYMCVNITIEYHTTLRRITTKEIPQLSDS